MMMTSLIGRKCKAHDIRWSKTTREQFEGNTYIVVALSHGLNGWAALVELDSESDEQHLEEFYVGQLIFLGGE